MSNIRGVKDRRFKFVQLLNSMFEDPNLILKAKGFIGYCLTKPSNWHFHIEHLCKVLKEGESAIYSVIKECIDLGYAFRFQLRDEKGEFLPWETVVSDSKHEIEEIKREIELKESLPHRGFPDADNPRADLLPDSNTETKETRIKQQQERPSSQKSAIGGAEEKTGAIIYLNTKGEAVQVSESDVFAHFLKLPYSTEEIQAAILQVRSSSDFIGNIFKYLEAICLRIHNSKSLTIKNLRKKDDSHIPDTSHLPTVNLGEYMKRNKKEKK